MPTVKANYTRVFAENNASTARTIVNVGGARSSKSYSLAQLYCQRFFTEKKRTSLISRKTLPALRATAMFDVVSIMQEWGVYSRITHNKSENTLTNPKLGNVIRFISILDPMRIRSFQANDIWLEEANEFTWEDFKTLQMRLSAPNLGGRRNQMHLSLNPSDPFGWVKQRLVDPHQGKPKGGEVDIINSSYRDNPSLSTDYVSILTGLKNEDEAYFKVYAEGIWAQSSSMIYSNYDIIPRESFPASFDEVFVGIDFGYNNPAALIFVGIKDDEAYIHELVYQSRLLNNGLIDKLGQSLPQEFRDMALLRADEAEPDRIEEFKQAGWRIEAAPKGKNSVRDGIDWCKRIRWHISEESPNVIKEARAYKWKEDSSHGITMTLDEPVKFMDHSMDAIRYALTGLQGYQAASEWGGSITPAGPEWA